MTDFILLEKIQRILKDIAKPRLTFRKGIWTSGYFRPYMSLADYTDASIFKTSDTIVPVRVRFSSLLGDNGTADTARNIKSMGIRFESDAGVYDMLCQSIPVLMINDKKDLLSFIDAFTVRDRFDGINTAELWKFIINDPKALNFVIRLYSYIGILDSYININYYSVNIYLWKNNKGEEWVVKCKWMPVKDNYTNNYMNNCHIGRTEAEFIAGYDPHKAIEEIENRVMANDFIQFELFVQMIKKRCLTNDLYYDHTYNWEDTKVPYLSVGSLILNKVTANSDDLVLCPGNTIDGIELWKNGLVDVLDYMCMIENLERGTSSWNTSNK